jgi:P-type Cu2+ transporter
MFRDKFWLSLLLTLPVVFWSAHIQMLLRYRAPEFPGSGWIPPILGTLLFAYGGWVFLQGAWRELTARLPGMMTLISLAITVAFVFSWVVQLGLITADALWWELATLVTIMLLGHWIEMRSITQAQGALQELAKLLPDTATRITDGRGAGSGQRAARRRPRAGAPRRERAGGRRRGQEGDKRRQRGDDHRRVPPGEKRGRATRSSPARSTAKGSLRVEVTGTARRRSSRGSCGWWPTRRSPSRGPSTWPTAPPSC